MKTRTFALVVALSFVLCGVSCRRDTTALYSHVFDLPKFDLSMLNEGQKQEFFKVVNAEVCPCSIPERLGQCIANGKACPDAYRAARFARRRIGAGDSVSRVVHMLDRMFQDGTKTQELPENGAPSKGAAKAPVAVTIFGDFQCPYCKRAKPELDKMLAAYPDKVRVVFRHLPLPIHKHAMLAAYAAEAAHKQGKFWPLHDELYKFNLNLEREMLTEYAKRVGLDVERWKKDIASPEVKARVEADVALAKKLGITGTPAVFVNGKQLNGAMRFENYRDYVEIMLDDVPAPRAALGAK